jgi:hypothetical protein
MAGPSPPQVLQVFDAFRLVLKSGDANIPSEPPFSQVAVLKDSTTLEIVLAQDAGKTVNSTAWHGIRPIQLPPGQVKYLLIPMDVAEEELGFLHVPVTKDEAFPAPLLVQHHLAGLELRFVAIQYVPKDLPCHAVEGEPTKVRPEDGPAAAVFRRVE